MLPGSGALSVEIPNQQTKNSKPFSKNRNLASNKPQIFTQSELLTETLISHQLEVFVTALGVAGT